MTRASKDQPGRAGHTRDRRRPKNLPRFLKQDQHQILEEDSAVDTASKVSDFQPGQRVQTHPATDDWMRGDRYGEVVHLGRKLILVKLDRSGKTKRFLPSNLIT